MATIIIENRHSICLIYSVAECSKNSAEFSKVCQRKHFVSLIYLILLSHLIDYSYRTVVQCKPLENPSFFLEYSVEKSLEVLVSKMVVQVYSDLDRMETLK